MSSLSPISELLLRNLDQLAAAPLWVINPPADQLATELCAANIKPYFFTTDLVVACKLQQQQREVEFAAEPQQAKKPWQQALLCWPKAKAHAELLLKQTLAQLAPNSELWVVGENKGGVNSAAKVLKSLGYHANKVDSARRCSLLFAPITQPAAAATLVYDHFTVPFQDKTFQCASLPGVFNHGRLDEGTRLLLASLENSPRYSGKAMDVGCGAGVISCALKHHSPELTVSAGDVNAMAVAATQETARLNQLDIEVLASDLLTEYQGTLDLVISNPPFHQGLETDYEISSALFSQAYKKLRQGGELRIVANGFLPYAAQISRIFGHCQVLSETRQFKVYSAVKT